ncbi:hypothetical protein roselon_02061 [Roseibacterium elongatum DSM 19469]|uniref:Excalibur calcium-binding domain-containing protein n=2 Tax=Roseicyclus elongatus TaxID=159346 RepID=W8S2L4_9RHOB|nr:hypothetical protein roselon_02061 [Roseibacterium elongatum DSM 19469]
MGLAALLGLAACGGVPSDVPATVDLQAREAFEARRTTLRGEPSIGADAAQGTAADTTDIATQAAAAIAEAEAEAQGIQPADPAVGAPAPADAAPGETSSAAGPAAPAGRGLPALPAEDEALALPGGGSPPDTSAPGCAQFATAGAAQNWFIANGGPSIDPDGLDPDGDGRVCGWVPPAPQG